MAYRVDVTGKDGGIATVHGFPGHTSVQNIIVDAEADRTFIGYEDEVCEHLLDIYSFFFAVEAIHEF